MEYIETCMQNEERKTSDANPEWTDDAAEDEPVGCVVWEEESVGEKNVLWKEDKKGEWSVSNRATLNTHEIEWSNSETEDCLSKTEREDDFGEDCDKALGVAWVDFESTTLPFEKKTVKKEASGFRLWKNKSQKHSVEAEFIKLKDEKVVLRTKENKKVSIEIGLLCEEDQQFLLESGALYADNARQVGWLRFFGDAGIQEKNAFIYSKRFSLLNIDVETAVKTMTGAFLREKGISEGDIEKIKAHFKKQNIERIEKKAAKKSHKLLKEKIKQKK
eukprot:GHVN01084240.1.p3 GENE.GHVN01084240.1~~GHVN01084240.1.p3  ORF type:complete len:275 (+),score=58.20 GHVN01084240.1:1393-2217(+)